MTRSVPPRPIVGGAAVALLLVTFPGPGVAQVGDTARVPVDSVVVTPEARPVIVDAAPDTATVPLSPRGAFIRSMVIPGWGQAAFDSHGRGSIYFAGWAANWFMIFRNQVRLDAARGRLDQRVDQIEAALIAASPNPDSLRAVMDTVPAILEAAIASDDGPGNTGVRLRGLVRSREQQREDWIAWSIFWILASGIDGYVTAHLADFPTDIDIRRNADRSVSVGIHLAVPRRRP